MLNLCCLGSKPLTEEVEVSKNIDVEIKVAKSENKNIIKILLLGAGDAGKSTYLKQIKALTGVNLSEEEVDENKMIIYANVIRGMQVLFDAAVKFEFEFSDPSKVELGNKLLNVSATSERMTTELFMNCVKMIESLWQDFAIKCAFDNRNKFLLADTVKYFLDELPRLKEPNYKPTFQDVLRCRKPTKSINEYYFKLKDLTFQMIDVGGQRSQRNKWCVCFDNVTAIIYMVPGSDFDKMILEDRRTNVISESLKIFESLVNNIAFKESSIIVYFNKTDLLLEKISQVSIKSFFPEFEGNPSEFEDVKNFYISMFKGVMPQKQSCFFYFTTAIDCNNAQFTMNAVKEIILENNLKSLLLE